MATSPGGTTGQSGHSAPTTPTQSATSLLQQSITLTSAAKGGSAQQPRRVMTYDKEQLFHELSDSQLNEVSSHQAGKFTNAFWTFLGIGIGSAIPGISAIADIVTSTAIVRSDAAQAFVFIASASVAAALGAVDAARGKRLGSVIDQLRKRPKRVL